MRAADVAVLGAGPAGVAVARRLAAQGASVVVVSGAPPAGAREGYSARTRARLLAEGLDEAVATLVGPLARSGVWGEGRAVAGAEWLADRAAVAAALWRATALPRIARLEGPATRVARATHGFAIDSPAGGVAARLVVDARGRRGPQSRGPLLLALGQRFQFRSRAPRTFIGPWSRGWCWLADDGESVYVQLAGRAGDAAPRAWFADAAREIPALRPILAAPRAGPATARPAHARLGRAGTDPGLWRVGDAALALDPLSGQGVFEALRGAVAVAAAVVTVLEGGDAGSAARFVAARHRESWRATLATAGGFYAENGQRGRFWSETAAAYARLAEPAAPEATRIERRPVLEDGRIREREVLVTRSAPRGAWVVDGVPLVPLLALVRDGAAIPDAAARLDRSPAAVAAALEWLKGAGALAPLSSGV
ncbi:MAG TPA: hypothetical protein VMT92_11170 [Steroidobacteraceae bacterium]|nr:hypothetical protein [Steroidobacteraceae bacterium]